MKPIKWIKLTREESLKVLPETVSILVNKYKFKYTWSNYHIENVEKFIHNHDNSRSWIFCCTNGWSNYWIVFRKNDINVYYTQRTELTSTSTAGALAQINRLHDKIAKAIKEGAENE